MRNATSWPSRWAAPPTSCCRAELARAAGIDYWRDVITQEEFNRMSRMLPVLVNARPFGRYSMVDIDAKGGLPVIVRELLAAGMLDGTCMTCTGETLAEQVARLRPVAPDGDVIHPLSAPFKPTGGLRLLRGNLAPDGGAVIKLAGVEGGMDDGRFVGRARVFDSEQALIEALATTPEEFQDRDMVVIRYEGPRGAPGMPEMLDPTSRITALCRQTRYHHRADDRRPLLGRIGGAGDRPRVARGGAGRADRPHRGRRHDRRRCEPGHPRLHRAQRHGDSGRAPRAVAGRGGPQRRDAPAGSAGRYPAAPPDARLCPPPLQGGGLSGAVPG